MKISFNAKVVLVFSFLCFAVKLLDCIIPNFVANFFTVKATISLHKPLDYFFLISHVLGHSSWEHLFSNLMFFLLLGPILEEKYGHIRMLFMILVTAFVTGIVSAVFFSTGLCGASGIVFMFIILASFVGKKDSCIPIEFLLVAAIFLGKETISMFKADNISQLAHILGGVVGAVFGYALVKMKEKKTETKTKET